ncbi:MAG: hypothetical protein Kapaf2KO_10940 [Candidatus Kapaibacteriales bacterium]
MEIRFGTKRNVSVGSIFSFALALAKSGGSRLLGSLVSTVLPIAFVISICTLLINDFLIIPKTIFYFEGLGFDDVEMVYAPNYDLLYSLVLLKNVITGLFFGLAAGVISKKLEFEVKPLLSKRKKREREIKIKSERKVNMAKLAAIGTVAYLPLAIFTTILELYSYSGTSDPTFVIISGLSSFGNVVVYLAYLPFLLLFLPFLTEEEGSIKKALNNSWSVFKNIFIYMLLLVLLGYIGVSILKGAIYLGTMLVQFILSEYFIGQGAVYALNLDGNKSYWITAVSAIFNSLPELLSGYFPILGYAAYYLIKGRNTEEDFDRFYSDMTKRLDEKEPENKPDIADNLDNAENDINEMLANANESNSDNTKTTIGGPSGSFWPVVISMLMFLTSCAIYAQIDSLEAVEKAKEEAPEGAEEVIKDVEELTDELLEELEEVEYEEPTIPPIVPAEESDQEDRLSSDLSKYEDKLGFRFKDDPKNQGFNMNPFNRLLRRISEVFSDILYFLRRTDLGRTAAIIAILGVIAFVIYRIRKLKMKPAKKSDDDVPLSEISDDELINRYPLDELMERSESEGDLVQAYRFRYLSLIKQLDTYSVISWKPSLTSQGIIRQIKDTNLRASFADLSKSYDYIWYGKYPLDATMFERLKSDANSLKNKIATSYAPADDSDENTESKSNNSVDNETTVVKETKPL